MLNYSHWCPCWIWMTSFIPPSVQKHALYRAGIELFASPPANSTLRNTEIFNAEGNLHIKRTLVNTRGTTSNSLLLVLVFVCELIVKLFQFDAKSECVIECIVNVRCVFLVAVDVWPDACEFMCVRLTYVTFSMGWTTFKPDPFCPS